MRVLAMLVAVVTVGASSAGGQDANKKALEALQGEWVMQKAAHAGKPVPEEKVAGTTMTFKEDKISIRTMGKDAKEDATFTIDTSKKPAAIDITPPSQPAVKGIFQIEGDTLKLAFAGPGGERPTEFASPEGGKVALIELRRAKK